MLESPIVQPLRDTPLVTSISQLREIFGAISDGQASMMQQVADRYTFRIPRFYLTHVLTNDPADPLWELALPGRRRAWRPRHRTLGRLSTARKGRGAPPLGSKIPL